MHPFTAKRSQSVAALGEEALIRRIRTWLGSTCPPAPFGIGDDCAVLPASARPQLVTVDPVIWRRHFDAKVPPRAVGEKLLKRNLSDIAAMGGVPRAAVVALALDARTKTAWVRDFYRGLAATARRYGVAVVGGDVTQADNTIAATLTLVGQAAGRRILTRGAAHPGDWIFVTGELGNSLSTGHHHRFEPRLAEGAWLAAQKDVHAMMDVSDGLAKDLHALTPARTLPALYPSAIPRRRGATLGAALSDGEDYELVFAVDRDTQPYDFLNAWRARFPRLRLSCIGEFVRPSALPSGALNLKTFRGYEHLR